MLFKMINNYLEIGSFNKPILKRQLLCQPAKEKCEKGAAH